MSKPQVYPLWQQKADSLVLSDKAPLSGAGAAFVTEITEPELIVFSAEKEPTTESAVIICPGGGYAGLALTTEGYDCARWLAEQGVTGMVLKYRLPYGDQTIPLEDVQAAFRFVRNQSRALGLRPDRIGVAGFSAGGHLAAMASTRFSAETRPDFAMLYYPVISLNDALGGMTRNNLLGGSPSAHDVRRCSCNLQVTPETPPTLIMLSDDDSLVPPLHSTLYYGALKKHGVPASLHIFPQGNHAWGFRGNNEYIPSSFNSMDEMKTLTAGWLKHIFTNVLNAQAH